VPTDAGKSRVLAGFGEIVLLLLVSSCAKGTGYISFGEYLDLSIFLERLGLASPWEKTTILLFLKHSVCEILFLLRFHHDWTSSRRGQMASYQ